MALIDGLSSYYKENDSTDSFGGRNLTDTSITYGTGLLGNCAIFNGTSSKQTGTHGLGTGDINFSYYGWLYVTGTQTRGEFLSIGNQANLNQGIHFSLRTKSGGNNAVYFDYSFSAGDSTTARVNYNAWNFIAITHATGGAITIRINNNSPESFAKTGLNVSNNVLNFSTYGSTNSYFNGKIDEVGLFSTIKTNTEFDSLYNGGLGLSYPFPKSGFFMFM